MNDLIHAVGVDWASGYWLAVEYHNEAYVGVTVSSRFEALWASFDPKPDRILVDVPIGLCDEMDTETGKRGRECDSLARRVLGQRSSSVFTPPARQAAEMTTDEDVSHAVVSEKNRDIVGKGLSIQAYHIAPGIAEIDSFLTSADSDEQDRRRERVAEAHPEVCFTAFKGEELEYAKTSAVGVAERLTTLESVTDDPIETFRTIASHLADDDNDVDVEAIDPDDVLDAMALAITACADGDRLQRLPANPPKDSRGLPMQIVYRAKRPFDGPSTN